ncbi:MAG: hypothetical protein HY954_11935 [Deltaproteobacteria bacterium]|nr:hypothetical protein [Deltaproteobacteria bacterium]
MSFFDYFNPTTWGVPPEAYNAWWSHQLSTTLQGFIPRFVASVSLGLAVFASFTRKLNRHTIILLFLLALVVTYYGTFGELLK